MDRRRLGALVAILVVVIVTTGHYGPLRGWVETLIERTPEPVLVAIGGLLVSILTLLVLVKVVRLLYPLLKRIAGSVMRAWDFVLPESVILRFGIILIVFTLFVLIGSLVALQTLEIGGDDDDTVDNSQGNGSDDDGGNTTETEAATGTAGTHTADHPNSPDQPPGD